MTLERITVHNIDYAVQIQSELFPKESARVNYEESLDRSSGYEYFLLYEDGECVGITGIYDNLDDRESAWLGWFGIRERYRRRRLGSEALRIFEEMAVSRGYRFARLYTDAENNDAAIAFYQSNGYVGEPYHNADDPACLAYRVLIFSKALRGGRMIPWNHQNIRLTEQIAKQEKGKRA